ncbi:MAG: hypothetical protein AAF710_00380 [Planctomycetota bacterium]
MNAIACRFSSLKICGVFLALHLLFACGSASADPVIDTLDTNWRPAKAVNFTPDADWRVSFEEGAEGSFEVVNAEDGRTILNVRKDNALGFVMIRPGSGLVLKNGQRYVLRCVYRSDDAPLSANLGLHVHDDPDATPRDLPFVTGGMWTMGHMFVVNTPPEVWSQRVYALQGSKQVQPGRYVRGFNRRWPTGSYPYVTLYGNPHTVQIRQIQIYPERQGVARPKPEKRLPYSEQEVLDVLTEREPQAFELVPGPGVPVMHRNGQPTAPAWSLKRSAVNYDYRLMGRQTDMPTTVMVPLGPLFIDFMPVASGEPSPFIWTGQHTIDFANLERQLMAVYRQNPNANVILGLDINPYEAWIEENPTETAYNDEGVRAYKRKPAGRQSSYYKRNLFYGESLPEPENPDDPNEVYYRQPSVYSEKYWADVRGIVGHLVEWLEDSLYANSIVGFCLMGGQDARFEPGPIDWNPDARAEFRRYLEKKYGTPEALSRAWKQPVTAFDSVELPPPTQVDPNDTYHVDGPWKDLNLMHRSHLWWKIDRLAGEIKAAWPRPLLITTYNAFDHAFVDVEHIDKSPNYHTYGVRAPGLVSAWTGLEFPRPDKMWSTDLDLRTHYTRVTGAEEFDFLLSRSANAAQHRAIHDKLAGTNLARGGGYFYFEHGGNNFVDDPESLDLIVSRERIAQRVSERIARDDFRPDVVVVRGNLRGHLDRRRTWAKFGQQVVEGAQLSVSGVPYDQMTLGTLMRHAHRDAYRVFVFSQNVHLDDAERAFIDGLKGEGRTLVFVGDTGYMSEDGIGTDKMSELIGIEAHTRPGEHRRTPMVLEGAPLTEHALPFAGGVEQFFAAVKPRGSVRSPITVRSPQPFWIQDDAATPLMRYEETGQVAAALKRFADWTSVYIAAHFAVEPGLFNAIAADAGAYVASTPGGKSIDLCGVFASIHATRTGEYPLTLPPGKTRLIDAFTGQQIPAPQGVARLSLEATRTYWYFFE